MVKKLTYLLTAPIRWNLLSRSLFLAVILAILFKSWQSGASFLWFVPVLFIAFAFYFSENKDRKEFRTTFWSLTFFSFLILWLVANSPLPPTLETAVGLISIVAIAATFGFLLGVIRFLFDDKYLVYNLINTSVLALAFLTFFTLADPIPGIYLLALFPVMFLIFKECFSFHGLKGRRSLVVSFAFALISIELAWFVALLPLGVINSSVFLVLLFSLLRDTFLAHFEGVLDRPFLLRQFGFMFFVAILVFASATWSL